MADVSCNVVKEKWLNVQEEHCILVEFINERDHLDNKLQQVGYLCWIDEDHDATEINEIIAEEKQVVIHWPNCDIKTPRYMKTLLKKAWFKQSTVTVLAYGSWLEMKGKQKNLENFNVLSPSKEQRRDFKSSKSGTSALIKSTSQLSTTSTKRKSEDEDDSEKEDLYSRIKNTKKLRDSEDREDIEDNDSKEEEIGDFSPVNSPKHSPEHEDLDDNDDQMLKLLESKDKEIASNQSIISCLNEDISNLKKKLYTSEMKYKELKSLNVDLQAELDSCRDELESKTCNKDTENTQDQLKNAAKDFVLIRDIAKQNIKNLCTNREVMLDIGNTGNITSPEKKTPESSKKFRNPITDDNSENDSRIVSSVKNNEISHPKKKSKVKEALDLYPTNYKISSSQLSNLDKSSVSSYARDLAGVLFTETELATHTATGGKCNANKDLPVKPGLDIERINAAKNECLKVFKKVKGFETLFNYGIKNKCAYCKQKMGTRSLSTD